MAITSAPSERNSCGASLLDAPFAQSITIFIPVKLAPGGTAARSPSR